MHRTDFWFSEKQWAEIVEAFAAVCTDAREIGNLRHNLAAHFSHPTISPADARLADKKKADKCVRAIKQLIEAADNRFRYPEDDPGTYRLIRYPNDPPCTYFDYQLGKLLDDAFPTLKAMYALAVTKAAEEVEPTPRGRPKDRGDDRLFTIAMLFWTKHGGEVNHQKWGDKFLRFAHAIFAPVYPKNYEVKVRHRVDAYIGLPTFADIAQREQAVQQNSGRAPIYRNKKRKT